jgi:hypothetical protein
MSHSCLQSSSQLKEKIMPLINNSTDAREVMAAIIHHHYVENIVGTLSHGLHIMTQCLKRFIHLSAFASFDQNHTAAVDYYQHYYEHANTLPSMRFFYENLRHALRDVLETNTDSIIKIIIASYARQLCSLLEHEGSPNFSELDKLAHCIAARLCYHYQHETGIGQAADVRLYLILCEARKDHHIHVGKFGMLNTIRFKSALKPNHDCSFSDLFKLCLIKPYESDRLMVHYTIANAWQEKVCGEAHMPAAIAAKLGFFNV